MSAVHVMSLHDTPILQRGRWRADAVDAWLSAVWADNGRAGSVTNLCHSEKAGHGLASARETKHVGAPHAHTNSESPSQLVHNTVVPAEIAAL